jgi:hypothetical protein
MNRLLLALSLFAIGLQVASPAMAAEKLFAKATETDDQLRKLYDEAGDGCLHSRSPDVRVTVTCASMRIYGAALNERGWCYGHRNEANVQMDWHRCDANSERFSLEKLVDGER